MIRPTRKLTLLLLGLALLNLSLSSQIDKYNDKFYKGYYLNKDSGKVEGLLKIYLAQNNRLKFKSTEEAEQIKISSDDILGFQIDTTEFQSMGKLKLIGGIGLKVPVKRSFAEVLDRGEIDMLLIYFQDNNPLNMSVQLYLNLVLRKKNGEEIVVPLYHRLKKRRIERIKAELKLFFDNDPEWNSRIDLLERNNGMAGTIQLVKDFNRSG